MNLGNKNKITIIFVSIILASIPGAFTYSADNAALEAQRAAKLQQLAQLNAQIKDFQAQIGVKRKQASTLNNEIALYNIEIKATETQLAATRTNIENVQIQIDEIKAQIVQKNQEITKEKTLLAGLIATLNEYQNASGIQITLSSASFSDFMDQVQYTQSLQDKVFSLLQEIKDLKAKLEQDQTELQANLEKLNQLQKQLNQTEKLLSDQRSAKVQLLSQTKGQEKRYQKLLTSAQDEEAKINQEIYNLDQQLRGKRNFNSLKPIHGILAWPMDGVVTQGYGNTGFTEMGYNFHNGIDIAAPPGTSIYAAADGVVIGAGSGQAAYGNWVAIKHTIITAGGHQIITLYAHMISHTVSEGQQVKKGDLIGYEGNTGNTTRLLYGPDRGYHLHFGVYDAEGFGIKDGAYPQIYGPYRIPYGYTYNPYDFL